MVIPLVAMDVGDIGSDDGGRDSQRALKLWLLVLLVLGIWCLMLHCLPLAVTGGGTSSTSSDGDGGFAAAATAAGPLAPRRPRIRQEAQHCTHVHAPLSPHRFPTC